MCVYTHIYIYAHTHKYYPVIKNNEIKPFATTWMNLEITIISEVRKINII